MNIKNKLTLSLIFLVILIFSSCSSLKTKSLAKTVEFDTNASNILINAKGSDTLSISLAVFSNKKISKIDFIGLEGNNIPSANISANIIDNSTDNFKDYVYRGLYFKYLMIDIKNNVSLENLEINRLVLNVDGKRRNITFKTPIKYEFSGSNVFTEALRISVIPNEFSSKFINNSEQKIAYQFNAQEDLLITDVHFLDFLKPINVTYSIDDIEEQKAVFPIKVQKGESIKIKFSISSQVANNESCLETDLTFEYTNIKENSKDFNRIFVFFDPVFPYAENDKSNADKLIESLNFDKN